MPMASNTRRRIAQGTTVRWASSAARWRMVASGRRLSRITSSPPRRIDAATRAAVPGARDRGQHRQRQVLDRIRQAIERIGRETGCGQQEHQPNAEAQRVPREHDLGQPEGNQGERGSEGRTWNERTRDERSGNPAGPGALRRAAGQRHAQRPGREEPGREPGDRDDRRPGPPGTRRRERRRARDGGRSTAGTRPRWSRPAGRRGRGAPERAPRHTPLRRGPAAIRGRPPAGWWRRRPRPHPRRGGRRRGSGRGSWLADQPVRASRGRPGRPATKGCRPRRRASSAGTHVRSRRRC